MNLKNLLQYLTLLCYFSLSIGFWEIPSSVNTFVTRWTKDTKSHCQKPTSKKKVDICSEAPSKDYCDENQLMLQLARLYIISPERIILLLTMDTLKETCQDIAFIMARINSSFANCIPLPRDNLYVKLYQGLEHFNSFICHHNRTSKAKHITQYQDCLQELREELIECEGPPDWFEKANETVVCKYFNEIINCNYVKAALLCGLTPALMLRRFSADVMKSVLLFKCRVSKSLPYVSDPMPSRGTNELHIELKNILLYISFCFILIQ